MPTPTNEGPSFEAIDVATAIPACQKAIAENSGSADSYAYLARALVKAKRETEAFKLLQGVRQSGSAALQAFLGLMYDDGYGVARDYAEAVRWYRMAAEQRHSTAQVNLGLMYDDGRGVAQDYAEAVRWYRKAAEQGDAKGENSLGFMYDNGRGVVQDYTEAVHWYRKAAEQGRAKGQANLGTMYEKGHGVALDYVEAARWYRKAAEQGHATGQTNLGTMYEKGHGVAQDYAEAVRWYRKAAEQGDATGQAFLGAMYDNGHGVAQDYAEAVRWYRKAAEQGDATGEAYLGTVYDNGHGVAQDYAEAARWYRRAAEQRNAAGEAYLGSMYGDGHGVTQDYAEAVRWYRKAAELGNAYGEVNLGRLYADGHGVSRDYTEAVRWYRKAAEQGDPTGENLLGGMYLKGLGVLHDEAEAVRWFRKAAEQGDAQGEVLLGIMSESETDNAKEDAEAVRWYRKAAEQGNPSGQTSLGVMYKDGRGVAQDYVQAVRWFRKAAEQGNATGEAKLGEMYEQALGVTQDYTEAVRWYRKAAEQRDSDGECDLGAMYDAGHGVVQDYAEAVRWFRKAAEQGDAVCQVSLGIMYETGAGLAHDYGEAMRWYRKAAEQGNAGAQQALGRVYSNSLGVAQDYGEAIRWFSKAAEQGNADAKDSLGDMYANGYGVAQDHVEAARWYRKAADQDNADAQYNLANLYENGHGVGQDYAEAARWYLKGAHGGSGESRARIGRAYADVKDALHASLIDDNPAHKALQEFAVDIAVSYEESSFDCFSSLVDCGEAAWRRVDLAEAARWYRMVADKDPIAAFRLGRLLGAHAELEQPAGEGLSRLHYAAQAGNFDAGFYLATVGLGSIAPDKRLKAVDAALAGLKPGEAAKLAFDGARGLFGDAVVAPAFLHLKAGAGQATPGSSIGLIAVYAFYGAFAEAENVAAGLADARWFEISGWDYSIDHLLSFWLVEVNKGYRPKPGGLDGLRHLLSTLSAKGSTKAGQLLSKLEGVDRAIEEQGAAKTTPDEAPTPLTTEQQAATIKLIKDRIAEKEKLGGLSPLLVRLYQSLALHQAALGQKDDASKSIMTALSIGEQINGATRYLQGSLIYHLEQSCQLRRASEDLSGLGQSEAALLLAKASVNELQDARAQLVGLPAELQGCFKDLISDQYRILADLFIKQGHFLEAEWVLGQLKDYETYEFNRDNAQFASTAFDHIPMTDMQNAIIGQIVGLPLLEQCRLSRRMAELVQVTNPDQQQIAEKAQLAAQLTKASDELEVQLSALRDAIKKLDITPDDAARLSQDLSDAGMQNLTSILNDLSTNTAIFFTVVLPDRVQILVSSKQGTEHIEVPIDEQKLNEMIGTARLALQDKDKDPTASEEALYQLLWKNADDALTKLDVTDVVLSLDGKLRYIPFPALYDGKSYLVERYRFTLLTSNRRDQLLAQSQLGTLTAQALGASQGGQNFSALPYVVGEIDGIVKDATKDTTGLLPGRRWLDKDFNRDGLGSALGIGSPIIHIATHFAIGANDNTSRMLLGDGGLISVQDIMDGRKAKLFDFSKVQLLVLSACQTALGNGHELESLAANMQDIGVRSVIATLWSVVDQSTATFMVRFYSYLNLGLPRGEALQRTQVDFIHNSQDTAPTLKQDASNETATGSAAANQQSTANPQARTFQAFSHPRYWAPFILMGQWK
ncbi:CHAT domain-containing protein [Rhizobium ruizarguesonis]|uniref:CHAT domain-containing protein n=1 Tax=Rhizobium ruizarguesonis TaxID=2081791 RepID=UPI002484B51F|nr:CHAT domain-containing protein [Rhizobium ruizarguesonis]